MHEFLFRFDKKFINAMHAWGIPILRISLGVVFFWFGALKILGVSPVTAIVASTYSLFPTDSFILLLGFWEVAIGLGLIFKLFLRPTLFLLWLQMTGTLVSFVFAPSLFFFQGNPIILTVEGEFVIKNLVLIAASIVIGGFEVTVKSQITNSKPQTNSNYQKPEIPNTF